MLPILQSTRCRKYCHDDLLNLFSKLWIEQPLFLKLSCQQPVVYELTNFHLKKGLFGFA